MDDLKRYNRNIDQSNEMYKAGHIPDHHDLRRMQTGAEKLQRDKDMKQFCRSSGESGSDPYFIVTDAYRCGYEQVNWND